MTDLVTASAPAEGGTPEERMERFLSEATHFIGADPTIMRDHRSTPRTPEEERLLAREFDPQMLERARKRIIAGLDEAFEMMMQTGAAPGAKWGDLTTAVYTASGDLVHICSGGVLAFATVLHYPVRFIAKYWVNDPTVQVRDGDGFIHNDPRYGNIHTADWSMVLPVFWEGQLIAWVATVVHEGENGAKEPGGMPSSSETAYDEGLRISPFRIVENGEIRRDLLTFLQNCVRDQKLVYQDVKVKLFAAERIKERLLSLVAEIGRENVVASLRKSLEDVEAEARRRTAEIPDGTYRLNVYSDSTLRENVLIKYPVAITVKGDELVVDWRGCAPQFVNRAINCPLPSVKTALPQTLLGFVWPDLPRSISAINNIEFLTDPGSCVDTTFEAPHGQSLQSSHTTFVTVQALWSKMEYSVPHKYGSVVAAWFGQINAFLFGGITQKQELVGNICADLNAMGGGARAYADGENAVQPLFGVMADFGEQEIIEEEVPFLQLTSTRIKRDNQAFGKFRGGMGYEMAVAFRGSPLWGFSAVVHGAKFPPVPGLFGGYGCCTYPLAKIKGVNVFDYLKDDPSLFTYDMVSLMNEQPFPGARYTTHHMGMPFELANEGEVYLISQGSGGGYGDVLERDPAAVMADLENDYISHDVAREVYFVVYDPQTYAVDEAATEAARLAERRARLERGVPYDAFVASWVTPEPPENLPFYGCWDDQGIIYATAWTPQGPVRVKGPIADLPPIMLPDPKDVEIATAQARIASLEQALRERGGNG